MVAGVYKSTKLVGIGKCHRSSCYRIPLDTLSDTALITLPEPEQITLVWNLKTLKVSLQGPVLYTFI